MLWDWSGNKVTLNEPGEQNMRRKILRVVTVPVSFRLLLTGQLEFIQSQGFEVHAVSADGPELAHYRNEGISVFTIPFTRTFTPFRDLFCLFKLVLYLLRVKPDIVHSHTPKAGLLAMMAAFVCRVPVRMHTVAGLPLMEAKGVRKKILFMAEWITYFFAHRVYPNSRGLYQYVNGHFSLFRFKLRMLGNGSSNGIDVSYFTSSPELEQQACSLRNQLGISSDQVIFGFIGRLVRDKGISELLSAFRYLSSKYENVILLLVGDLEQIREPLPVEDVECIRNHEKIIFTGFQEDVRPWLLTMDVFVFPSYREGFPNALVQAACMERACVASSIIGCEEIIDHGRTGMLVPAKDASALSQAMEYFYLNPGIRKTHGAKARQDVVTRYSRQLLWDSLLKEYRSFLNAG